MIFLELFTTFFLIGAFTFGGGYAMLPLIQAEVLRKGWMAEEQILNFIAVSESTPGPFAINIATYVGSVMGGESVWQSVLGAFCATLGVVLPSFIVILIVAQFFMKFKTSKVVSGCMSGLRPAVIGMISSAIVSMAMTAFFYNGFSFESVLTLEFVCLVILFVISLVMALKKVHPIIIIVMSAAFGIAFGYAEKLL